LQMSFFVGSAARRAAPPFGISMLGAAEPPLRRGFACGKTLVRRTSAAAQKGRWVVFLQRFVHPNIHFNHLFYKKGHDLCRVLFWGERAAQCPDVAFRPRIPTRSRAAKKSRAGAAGSLNRMMPAIRAPRAPIPVQMA